MTRKPAVFLSSYSTIQGLCYTSPNPPPPPRTSSSCPHQRRPHPNAALQTRNYAQHTPPPRASHGEESDLTWPEPIHPHKTPTPYQILSSRKGAPYAKQRFYSLVKLYHPDQCHPSSPVFQLPRNVRLERYRLLIAAHTILSDPAKRSAYDIWGHGWAGHHQTPDQHASWESSSSRGPYHPRQWPPGHDPIHNATWEDWERWYERERQRTGGGDGGSSQQDTERAVYMSNFGFLSALFALVSIGSILQGTRANAFSSTVMEHRDKMHKEASLELGRSKRATMASRGDRNERIETFLRHREAIHTGEESFHRILPDAERCETESLRKH